MYDNGIKSNAHKVMVVVFAVVALAAIGAAAKIVLDRVDGDGTIKDTSECGESEGKDTLREAGVYGDKAKGKCKDKK